MVFVCLSSTVFFRYLRIRKGDVTLLVASPSPHRLSHLVLSRPLPSSFVQSYPVAFHPVLFHPIPSLSAPLQLVAPCIVASRPVSHSPVPCCSSSLLPSPLIEPSFLSSPSRPSVHLLLISVPSSSSNPFRSILDGTAWDSMELDK